MNKSSSNLDTLRQRAEQALARHGEPGLGVDAVNRLVEELRVYQTELELQNQELNDAQARLHQALDKYQSLFTLLPLPALLVDSLGFIVEANQAAMTQLQLLHPDNPQRYSVYQLIKSAGRTPLYAALHNAQPHAARCVRASNAGLSYVKLEGNIGCLVNGAGLAMSTMDIIKLHGGQPANFLDVGGGANAQQVTEAFRILLSDANVKGVLVNIFGGIMRCTTIAQALLEAYRTVGFNVPLVVRLEGTEVEQGRKLLAESGVNIITAEGLTDAAKKVVAAVAAAG